MQWGELPPARKSAAAKSSPSGDEAHSAFQPDTQSATVTTPSFDFSPPTNASAATASGAQPSIILSATSSAQNAALLAQRSRSTPITSPLTPILVHPSETPAPKRLRHPAPLASTEVTPSCLESAAADSRDSSLSNDSSSAQARHQCWRCYLASAAASIVCFCVAVVLMLVQLHFDGNAAAAADTQLSKDCHSFYGVARLPKISPFRDVPDASFLLFFASLVLAAAARSNFIA